MYHFKDDMIEIDKKEYESRKMMDKKAKGNVERGMICQKHYY